MSDENRVQKSTADEINKRIEQQTRQKVLQSAGFNESMLEKRLDELENEWSVERVLELNASALTFTGVVLGATVNRKWLWLSGLVTAFLFQHAVQGWCPPLPVFRRLGVRTRGEIDEEKFSLKALRGDFDTVPSQNDKISRAKAAWQAVKA